MSRLALAVNLGAALIAVLAWTGWREFQLDRPIDTHLEGSVREGYYAVVDDVGYVPRPNQVVTARRVTEGKVMFDVSYTIGPDGFRIVPGSAARPSGPCMMMFGDSNTFGEGVNDAETYSAQLARRGNGRWGVYDFGVSGWAAHEMLAGLQSGRFARSLACTPTNAVFFLISDHFRRIVGYAPWEQHTPRYRLGPDGRPVRDGRFDSDGPPVTSPPPEDSSLLTVRGWRRLLNGQPPVTPAQEALMAALLIEAARTVRDMAPQTRFDVIYWTDEDDALLDRLADTLRAAGIGVHPVETIVPGYRRHWQDYVLSDVDRHPTVATHGRIADYIARQIVKR